MKLMDIDSEQLGIPETDYDAKIKMPAGEFAKIMRDLKDLGESVRIEATSEGVKFTAEGEIGTGSVTLKPTADWEEGESKKKKATKTKVKKERAGSRVKKEENGDDSDDAMEEDDEDVKPKVKPEPTSDDEEEGDDDEEGSGSESEEEERPKKKKAAPKGKGKKAADSEDSRQVYISVSQSVSLNFSIKYLNNFAKSTPLSEMVSLQMSNDVPLLVSAFHS
jgi:proliferating cell nuclear antigen